MRELGFYRVIYKGKPSIAEYVAYNKWLIIGDDCYKRDAFFDKIDNQRIDME